MANDSKNLVEEIIDNALTPLETPENQDTDAGVQNIDPDILKRTKHDPLNENLVPDADKP